MIILNEYTGISKYEAVLPNIFYDIYDRLTECGKSRLMHDINQESESIDIILERYSRRIK